MSETTPDRRGAEGIAVIGAAGRFPGAANLEEYWRNLRDGIEGITFYTRRELEEAGVSAKLLDDPRYVPASGSLAGVELFDAAFFGFSPREAEIMDPQHRIFLECSWQALEDAGYDAERYSGSIGIFGGMSMSKYLLHNLVPHSDILESAGPLQIRILNDKDFLVSLAAFKLNLTGPSLTVQTACSTSLVATCLACQSLLDYQCDMALAGGVAIAVPHRAGYLALESVMSPDGHCRAFDAAGRGTVEGSGVGVVVLKRLADALADGDTIHAVIRGFATNNDGSFKMGYSAPSVEGQMEVVAMAQAVAGVRPDTITLIEAHGTGTPLGDPIEVAALTEVFAAAIEKKGFCALGSVKTNIGHLDAAAGVASLLKAVFAVEHALLPPSLHFRQPNPQIDFASSPFYVNTEAREWRTEAGVPRRAGVSSFAMGGVNAHVVIEEAPAPEPSTAAAPWQLLVLSARSETAVEQACERLAAHLEAHPGLEPADVAFTLQMGRRPLPHRRALVCRGLADAVAALRGGPPRLLGGVAEPQERLSAAFLFPGLGNQYVGMAGDLYGAEEVFRRVFDECAERLAPYLGGDLRAVVYPGGPGGPGARGGGSGLDLRAMLGRGGEDGEEARRLNRTRWSQPAVFAVEYALARLLMSWGVQPSAMLGFSIGEYVAACLAGVMSLSDALRVVAERARLIDELPEGAMLAVPLSEAAVAPWLGGELSVAAVNGPKLVVLSGPAPAIARVERLLGAEDKACRRLQTTHAFHSRMMEPLRGRLLALFESIELRAPEIPYVSNLTGTWITPEQATDPVYWADHLERGVRFADGLGELWREPGRVLVEVGPGQTLGAWAMQHPDFGRVRGRTVVPALRHSFDRQDDRGMLLGALGRLWLAGLPIDWTAFWEGQRRRRVPLPTYPFQRQRYWIEPPAAGSPQPAVAETAAPPVGPLGKRGDVADWFWVPSWRQAPPLPAADLSTLAARRWLLFLDGCSVGKRMAARLREAGAEVAEVVADRDGGPAAGSFCLAPSDAAGYDRLFEELHDRGGLPDVVVHLWGLSAVTPDGTPAGRDSFWELVLLAQAIGRNALAKRLDILVVTSGLWRVTGGEPLSPEAATALGPIFGMPQEYPNLSCRGVDVVPSDAGAPDGLAELLIAESLTESSEPVAAYRSGQRWLRGFEPVRLEAREGRALLREQGVYLITGGLGGVGLALAERLAESCRARLALLGRSPFPPAEQWEARLAEPDLDPEEALRLRALQRIVAAGGEVLVFVADVTDEARMQQAVEAVRTRFGALHGVIHAAGVSPGGLIQTKEPQQTAAVFAPKVEGTRILDRVLASEPLDFLVLCSSLTAIGGGLGLVDHCSANAFLDAFAQRDADRRDRLTVAVDWDAWLEVGQAARAARQLGFTGRRAEPEREPPGEPFDHPLLARRSAESLEREVFTAMLSPVTHWVVDEHRLQGYGMVPGTAYLEMIRAAFAAQANGGGTLIRRLVFAAPVLVPERERVELRTVLERVDGGFAVRVESRGPTGNWQSHVSGRIERTEPAAGRRFEVSEIAARCTRESLEGHDGESPSDPRARGLIRFGPRWQGLIKALWVGKEEGLALLELDERFAGDLEGLGLHPALMDGATGFVQLLGDGTYLPLGYEEVHVHASLPRRVYSWFRADGARAAGAETLACDLSVLDEQGRELVGIRGYTLRRLDPQALPRPLAAIAGAVDDQPQGQLHHVYDVGILPREGGEVLMRLLSAPIRVPQVLVSTRDFPALMHQARELTRSQLLRELEQLHPRTQTHPRPNLHVPYAASRTELERQICAMLADVLRLGEVGVHDGFFDLGGDSLLATTLVSRLNEALAVELSLRSVFEAPTAAQLAVAAVERQAAVAAESRPEDLECWLAEAGAAGAGESADLAQRLAALEPAALERLYRRLRTELGGGRDLPSPIEPRPRDGTPVPLSFAQQRLWFIEQLTPGTPAYNIATAVELIGGLDIRALEAALGEVVRRHEVLRTSFPLVDGVPVQHIAAPVRRPLAVVDLTAAPDRRKRSRGLAVEEADRLFDLERGPLLRWLLLRVDREEYVLLVTIHHLLADRISHELFIGELIALYRAFAAGEPSPLPEPALQYADFTFWHRKLMNGGALTPQIEYWKRNLAGAPLALELPTDRPRPEAQSFHGARLPLDLGPELTRALAELGRAEGTTLFMTLIAGFYLLLAHASGQSDLVVGTPVSGRTRRELEGSIGLFANTLALRVDLAGDLRFDELLGRVRESVLGAFAHQEVPLEKVVEELRLPRDPSRQPLFQVMFHLQDGRTGAYQLPGLTVRPLEEDVGTVKFDLTVFLLQGDQGVRGWLIYNTDLFDATTVAHWEHGYVHLLWQLAERPHERLSSLLDGLRQEERRQRSAGSKRLRVGNLQLLEQLKREMAMAGAGGEP